MFKEDLRQLQNHIDVFFWRVIKNLHTKKYFTLFQTTNQSHGRKPLLDLMGYHDPSNMRTPRFLEMCPTSLRFRDQRL